MTSNDLQRWASERGYRVAWGPAGLAAASRDEVRSRVASGELDRGLADAEMRQALGTGSVDLPTLVLVVVPVPAWVVGFALPGGALEAVLPPTYARYGARFEEIRLDLAVHGLPGARVEHLAAPLKALAARLGLVRWGRNNVTYAAGLGSWVQLCGYSTDAALGEPPVGVVAPALLDECERCLACADACPTSAIDPDRVLIHAERCLTLASENAGDWPSWVPAGAFDDALIGCLRCQLACPANPDMPRLATDLVFSPAETAALLSDDRDDARAAAGVACKLAWLGQQSYAPVLGRNLRALLTARPRPAIS